MSANPFIRPPEGYIRDLDLIGNANKDAAHFLSIKTNQPFDKCLAFVEKEVAKDGKFPIESLYVKATKRNEKGDREKTAIYFDTLLKGVEKTNSILTPNLVVYDDPLKNRSFLSKFIDDKMALRSVVKKRAHKAKMEGDGNLATFCDNVQTTIKTLINSLSGAHASPHNPHYNKTAHSTLTSSTRIATSYANAATERLLTGNRHYRNKEVTFNNIISITRNTDYDLLAKVVERYNLHIPTVTEVMELITRCTEMYWGDPVAEESVLDLVNSLNGLQRAAFTYTGDFYHLAKFNDVLIRGLFTEIITRPETLVDNPDDHVKNCNGDVTALCGILCSDFLAGMQVGKLKDSDPQNYLVYASTVASVNSTINTYADLIKVFLVTDNVPPSIYYFPSSIRRCVVGSDTDSTMFTCQDWVIWYYGKLSVDIHAQRISATMMYFNTQVIAHSLALASRHLGVEEKNIFRLSMKNEYSFLVYMVANRAKHYITMINAKEGNIYKVPEIDIKGVALKDSKIPPKIMKTLEALIKGSMQNLMDGEKIEIYKIFQRIANIEHEILNSINSGNIEYLSRATVKAAEGYKNPNVSVYAHYTLWKDVFAEKYGHCDVPPYAGVKISNTIDTNNKFMSWVATMDSDMQSRMGNWMKTYNKKYVGQFILPAELMQNGIPKEFISAIDTRRILSELMAGYYIFLEICGFYMRNGNVTRLMSDDIPYRPELGTFLVD